jgi:hypothetical protein
MLTAGVVEGLLAVVGGEPAPVAIGGPASAGDSSPSQERLTRIAAMLRDADQAAPVGVRRRPQTARLVPLAPHRSRARARAATVGGGEGEDLAAALADWVVGIELVEPRGNRRDVTWTDPEGMVWRAFRTEHGA